MNASELKFQHKNYHPKNYYFTPATMKFWGDTMRNYGVRDAGFVQSHFNEHVACWELYRKRPVKNDLQTSTYFAKDDFRIISPRN